jgi:hypothetical protein
MGLVATVNAFALLFGPLFVLTAVNSIQLTHHLFLLALSVAVQILQLFIVASFSIRNAALSDVFARCTAAAVVPALFFFLLKDARAKKVLLLNSAPGNRAQLLATATAVGALVVHFLGPFYYSIGIPGFDEQPLVSGAKFNLRLVSYLATASALSNGQPLWLSVAAAAVGGLRDSLECEGAATAVVLVLALWFSRNTTGIRQQ